MFPLMSGEHAAEAHFTVWELTLAEDYLQEAISRFQIWGPENYWTIWMLLVSIFI